MRKNFTRTLYLVISAITVCTSVFLLITFTAPGFENEEAAEAKERDGMELAWQQEFEMTKDPALGYVPTERLIPALQYSKNSLAAKNNQAIPGIQWTALGSKNYGGRTRAVMVDLNDATRKTVWAGSVGGGLWKTTDITAAEPNWIPVDDLMGNLAITTIAQDPGNPQIMYLGTGEGYSNSDAIRGLGIWKSTNGGVTWSQLPVTNNSTFYYIKRIVVTNEGALLVGTNNGLQRSADGGNSFTKVLGSGMGITGAATNTCYDIEKAANGDIYASLASSLHKSTNGGTTFGAALPIGVTASRIEIATAASNSNYVYALIANGSVVNGIVQSTNGGLSFTTRTEPADADNGISATDFSRSQAWYDLTIAVSPTDPLTVFVGGVDLFKSIDGCGTWQQVAHWYGGFGFQEVHADQHEIIFSPGNDNIVYFTNDGAIYRSGNANDLIPTIQSKGTNYNTLQFYACAMNPAAGSFQFLAGAQDNGSHKFTQSHFANTTEVTGGDGAFCHIDQDQPQYQFTSYVYNSYYRSTDGGNTFPGSGSSSGGRFINPTDYDDLGNKMYCAIANNQYLRWDNPQTGNTFTTVSCPELNGNVSAVKVSPNTPNRVFFGTGSSTIVRVDNANTNTPTATQIQYFLMSGYVSCIEVQPGNDNHILATFSNYGVESIWETTDGGTTWASIENNLPDMPVRWVIFNPTNTDQAFIATELGVWSTSDLNGAGTVWDATNDGLANVRVDMLQSRPSDKLIIAATHGRGLYFTGAYAPATANFTSAAQIVYPGRALPFTNTSINAATYSWNFGDGTFATTQHAVKKYNVPGTYNVSLSINGGASTVSKTIIVMPWAGTPYAPANGGNFETNLNHFVAETITGTGWERGNSTVTGKNGVNSGSNGWVTGLTASNYVDYSESYLYTPTYNLSAAGTYTFSFYTKYVFEADYDGIRVEYSIDTGKTWIPLGTTVASNWYNFANGGGTTAFPFAQAFFSATQASFAKKSRSLSFLAGNNQVAFRFAFKTDAGVTAAGAVIDDVEITGSTNAPLPLNLISFTAAKDSRDALLKWVTANEVNVSHFEIERSWNGTDFTVAGKVNAQNKTENNYAFKDLLSKLSSRPSNNVFYRLKMIDRDGKSRYSQVESLKWSDLQNSQVSISPNPFRDYIQISTQLKVSQVQLVDNHGRIVATASSLSSGRFNVPSLPAGMYYLRIHTSEGIITEKVMRQ
jgi:photosystem II stability/assembly factor-like uncharacterized protein